MDESEVVFCRICLRINLTQKYVLEDIHERKFIERIFKEKGYYQDLDSRTYACFECRSYLHKTYNFIQKALTAQRLLYQLLASKIPLTYITLNSLKRDQHGIASKLSLSITEADSIQCFVHENLEDTVVKIEPDNNTNVNGNSTKYIPDSSGRDEEFTSFSEDVTPINVNQNSLDIEDLNNRNIVNANLKYIDPVTGELTNIDPSLLESEKAYLEDPQNSRKIKNNLESIKPVHLDQHIRELKEKLESIKMIRNKNTFNVAKDTNVPERTAAIKVKRLNLTSRSSKEVDSEEEGKFRKRKNVNYRLEENRADVETEIKESKVKKKKKKDEEVDFVPSEVDSSDESADASPDSCNEYGRIIKKQLDRREFPMECEQCESIIVSRTDHKNHYAMMHKDIEYPYSRKDLAKVLCADCGEYINRRRLSVHALRHSGQKLECDYCHKLYSSREHMVIHIRTRHSNAPFKYACGTCNKEFHFKSDLRLHIRTHTGEKPFKCHLCEYRCAHKGNLIPHVRQVHHMVIPKKNIAKNKEKKTVKGKNVKRAKNNHKRRKRKAKAVSSDSE